MALQLITGRHRAARGGRRGSVLLPALLFALVLAGVAATYSTAVSSGYRVRARELRDVRVQLAAESGIADAFADLRAGGSGVLGSEAQPVELGGFTYRTELRALGGGRWSLVAIGSEGRSTHAMEALLERASQGAASAAVFAFDRITLASNASVDSYDPANGTYASQATTLGSVTFASRNGHLMTNGSLELASNSAVFGDARWGPDGDDTFSSSGMVDGDASPLDAELGLDLPEAPTGASSGSLSVPARATTTLGPGTVILDDVLVQGRGELQIVGPADVVMSSFELATRAAFSIDASGGDVRLFVGGTFTLNSNATVNVAAEDATHVTLVLLAEQEDEDDRHPPLAFDSNGTWIGRILAPYALVDVSSNFEVFGSICARWVNLSSNTMLHYDERLAETEEVLETQQWTIVGTRRLSSAQLELARDGGSEP